MKHPPEPHPPSGSVLSLVNFQHDLPNLPVDGIEVWLRLPQRIRHIRPLPNGKVLRHRARNGLTTFQAPRLEILAMFALNHA